MPLRLGLNELDLIYEDYLKEALKLPQTVGIIGGSPRHAVYILGFQDESFIDLDPHFCQTTVNVLEKSFDLSVRVRLRTRRESFDFDFRLTRVRRRKNSRREKWIRVALWVSTVETKRNSKCSARRYDEPIGRISR